MAAVMELVRDGARARAERAEPRAAVTVRRAGCADVAGIVALVDAWAAEALLLPRSAAEVAAALDDYVVAVDGRGAVLACAALREYSPSLAELVSVAVSRSAQGLGLGRRVVERVERLALARGHRAVFAHTLQPAFFTTLGYAAVDRALYPEKRARAHTVCLRRELDAAMPAAIAAAIAAAAPPAIAARATGRGLAAA